MPSRSPLFDEFPPNNEHDELYDTRLTPRRKPPSPPPTRRSKNPSPILMIDSRRDLEGSRSPGPAQAGFFDRLTKLSFNLRTLSPKDQDHLPMQVPHENQTAREWPPLRLEKRMCDCHHRTEKQKKRRRWATIVLIIILLYLLGNVVALNVRVLSPTPTPSSAPPASSSSKLSADATQCISQYNLNAPSNPPSFPCSSCLPILQSIPSNFQFSNAQDGQTTMNAIQFCGLKAIFDSSSSSGQANLANGGFLKDVKFCAWNGVSCDGSGRISALQLTFPGVPSSLPNEIGSLTGLQTFQVIGSNAFPAGSLPASFTNLTAITTLHLESTAISALPDNLFTALKSVTTLALVKNTQMGSNVPSSVFQIPLQNMVITGQNISNPLQAISSSSSLQSSLKFIDLSGDSLTGTIPSSISSLSALTELHLDTNALQSPLPPTFPSSLQIISLSGNAGINGTVPASLCSMTLQTCNLGGTGLKPAGSCGVCTFS